MPLKYSELSTEQKRDLFNKHKEGKLTSPEALDAAISAYEPSMVDKAIEVGKKVLPYTPLGMPFTTQKFIKGKVMDALLPEKKESDLTPQQKIELEAARLDKPNMPWDRADAFLAGKANEEQIDLLQHPRFLAHPTLAKGLGSLAHLGNLLSSKTPMRALGIGEGPRLADISPTLSELTGENPSARDVVSTAIDLASPIALGKVANMAKTAAAAKPNLIAMPEPYTKAEFKLKPPAKPTLVPKPVMYRPEQTVQDYADLLRREAYLELQKKTGSALESTLSGLKQPGISGSNTVEKIVNSYNLPISKASAEVLIEADPNQRSSQILKRALDNSATGEVRTKGNLISPEEQFIIDKGERTPIKVEPTSKPVIGEPHPSATINQVGDPRWNTQFQEGMQTNIFPEAPLMGEAGFTTTEPLDPLNPIKGRQGSQKLYNKDEWIGKPDEIWHTPETEPAIGGAQKTLPIEENPDLYKWLQHANEQANYAPADLEPWAMRARREKFGKVANELRDTIKKIDQPLPENLTAEDIANFERAGGEGTTGEKIQNIRQDVTNRIGLQEDLAPLARNDKSLALVKRGTGLTDDAAMFQKLKSEYALPQLEEQASLLKKAELHNKNVEEYLQENARVSQANKLAEARHEEKMQKYARDVEKHNQREQTRLEKHEEKVAKLIEKNTQSMTDFTKAPRFGLSQKDLSNLATYSLFAPMGSVVKHLAAKKLGTFAAHGLKTVGKYIPENTSAAESAANFWKRATLANDITMSRNKEEDNKK